MKILSFDVGISNLAYCYSQFLDNQVNILEWGLIDLNKDNNMCYHIACNKDVKYYINSIYSCKKHASLHPTFYINHTKLSINQIRKLNISDIKNICKSYNLEENKYKTNMISTINTFLKNKCFNPYKKVNASTVDLVKIGCNIKNIFDKTFHPYDFNIILIENQIGPLATRMKSIQGMITQYFIIRQPLATIKYISSFNKLKFFTEDKLSYKDKKKLAIQITEEILHKNCNLTKWIDFFKTHKKKDDLADSLLQTIVYMRLT
jgi:hypothetical protein